MLIQNETHKGVCNVVIVKGHTKLEVMDPNPRQCCTRMCYNRFIEAVKSTTAGNCALVITPSSPPNSMN